MAGVVHEIERLDLIHDWLERQAAAVGVAGERAADTQSVSARLLLMMPHWLAHPLWTALQMSSSAGHWMPPSTRDEALSASNASTRSSPSRVDQDRRLAELLTAHRVPAAGDRHRLPGGLRAGDDASQLVDAARRDDRRRASR